jgi:Ca2+:H+ antiporter
VSLAPHLLSTRPNGRPACRDLEEHSMIFRWLLLVVPLSLALTYLVHAPPLVQFAAAMAGIIPLAEWIRRATDHLARTLGSAIGGLLNVTFGNVAELLLAVFVLLDGHADVVKGQITGSIIGNGLLGLGVAVVVGSWGREKQRFNRASAGGLSSLLILSVIALLLPALFNLTERHAVGAATTSHLDERLSLGVSVVLLLVYAANLVYTLVTHRDVFAAREEDDASEEEHGAESEAPWPVWRALAVLLGGTAFVAWEAEIVSSALTEAAGALGVTTFFLGVIVLAVIGNASEYLAAAYYARKNRMTMAMSITVGSSIQVALLVAPLLVILSYFLGRPMNLVFANPLELIAIASVAFIVNAIAQDGETTWFEGVLLLAVYALFVLAFYFVVP